MSALRTTDWRRSATPARDRVPGEVADAVVNRLEVVDVEDHEGELAIVAVGTRAFADEGLVEVAAVVEGGQRVEIGELAGVPEAARVLDRRPCTRGELLESGQLLVGRFALLAAPEDGESADRLAFRVAQRY